MQSKGHTNICALNSWISHIFLALCNIFLYNIPFWKQNSARIVFQTVGNSVYGAFLFNWFNDIINPYGFPRRIHTMPLWWSVGCTKKGDINLKTSFWMSFIQINHKGLDTYVDIIEKKKHWHWNIIHMHAIIRQCFHQDK